LSQEINQRLLESFPFLDIIEVIGEFNDFESTISSRLVPSLPTALQAYAPSLMQQGLAKGCNGGKHVGRCHKRRKFSAETWANIMSPPCFLGE
jgi:hypothetical protein